MRQILASIVVSAVCVVATFAGEIPSVPGPQPPAAPAGTTALPNSAQLNATDVMSDNIVSALLCAMEAVI